MVIWFLGWQIDRWAQKSCDGKKFGKQFCRNCEVPFPPTRPFKIYFFLNFFFQRVPLNFFFPGEVPPIFFFSQFPPDPPPRSLLVVPLRCSLKFSGTKESHSPWLLDWFLFKEYFSQLDFGNHDWSWFITKNHHIIKMKHFSRCLVI